MRRVVFATSLCLGAWVSTVCGAPPNRQHIIDQQQQLVEAQREDDLNRQTVEQLAKQLRERYGEVSTLRIAADQLSHLDRARDSRAAQFWELLGIAVPLKTPLADAQRSELETFAGVFKDTAQGRLAGVLLIEHKTLLRSGEAKEKLAQLQLKSTADELSETQLTHLIEIQKDFSATDSAAVAGLYLRAHFSRRSREELAASGLLTPEVAERLASRRLTQAQERFGHQRDTSPLRQALAEIVEDYPGTRTSRQAGERLVEVQKVLNADAEQSRFVREYWDAAYPSRIRKPNGVQQ